MHWETPRDWLNSLLQEIGDIEVLRCHALILAATLDNDAIQDIFEDEMDADGYFEESIE